MFGVLSRSRKVEDSACSLVGFSTCEKTEDAVQRPSQFILQNEAELTLAEKKMTCGASTRFCRAADLRRSSAS